MLTMTPLPAVPQTMSVEQIPGDEARSTGVESEVGIRPGADDASGPCGLVLSGEEVVGSFEGNEAARMTGGPEDVACILDADGVVGR